jgi:hypothetical protein
MLRWHLFLVCALGPCLLVPVLRADEPARLADPDIQIDARGPVHEAYAQPHQANPGPNAAVDKKPPEPIPEEPAAEKPAGQNVRWMPGYWQWDVDRKDFIWASGFWRDVPQGRRWVMGYWTQVSEGNRWVSGHWAADPERDNQYVPEPPKNPDQGPPTAAPDDSSFYVPGTHFYGENGYSYRDGYWADVRPGMVWVPARYIWTPNGYVFASGFYFARPLWLTAGWYYRPSFVIGFNGLYGSLFVGAGYGHYYFGDWYARGYLGFGITPWFQFGARFYDPLWVHARWVNRGNPGWAAGVQAGYIARVNGTAPLPARTFSQTSFGVGVNVGGVQLVYSYSQIRQTGVKLEPVTAQQHTAQLQSARQMVTQSQEVSRSAAAVPFAHGGAPAFHPTAGSSGMGRPAYAGSGGGYHGGGGGKPPHR